MPEMDSAQLRQVLETLLFITDRPLPLKDLARMAEVEEAQAETAVRELQKEFEEGGRPEQILEVAGGFQMATRPRFAAIVRRLYKDRLSLRLSQAALETLSIIAYKQPITRSEIEEIRGVEVIAALETLLEKRLVRVVGRKEVVGRPLLYGTTFEFLRHFGLKSLEELPPLDAFAPPPPSTSPAAGGGDCPGAVGGPEAGGGLAAAEDRPAGPTQQTDC